MSTAAGASADAGAAPEGSLPRVWDCHTDVLSKLLVEPVASFRSGRGEGATRHYDLDRLDAGGVAVMVCALFSRDDTSSEPPVQRTLRMIDNAYAVQALTEQRVEVATSMAAVDRIVADGRTAIVLSIENGIACLDKVELLRCYYRLGVRAMGLTWNGRNYIADGCFAGGDEARLTPFGRDVIAEMGRLGMLVDVSHLADGAFWDVIERVGGPLIASHSNVRAITGSPRNLTDDQIRAITARGGVIGVNFYPGFLREQSGDPFDADAAHASFDDLYAHVSGLLERAGEDAVGIGSDYDGIPHGPEGAADPSAFPSLRARLAEAGLSEAVLDKVFFGNFRRVFGQVVG